VLCDLPVLGDFGWLDSRPAGLHVVCGVGSNATRRRFVARANDRGLPFATLVHPTVSRSRFVEIGEGSVVCAGTVLTVQIRVGAHVNLNLDCTVGHDAVLEDFCNLSPGVHVSGGVHLEEGVDVGTGAVILPGRRVGQGATLGAGAVVTSDIPALSVAVGVPARVVRTARGQDP
jgi:sugar O-acyltransferase (sialic acid O-acetyltransferase NeuD family)